MSTAGVLELIAWVLSAVIAIWLVADMTRVSMRYDEQTLINPGEGMEAGDD